MWRPLHSHSLLNYLIIYTSKVENIIDKSNDHEKRMLLMLQINIIIEC